MAGYREHIAVSGTLGVAYGVGSALLLGFTLPQAALAGYLTGFGGMLPDLDSESGRPIRELFSLLGAIVPLLIIGHITNAVKMQTTPELIALLFIVLYYLVRYGGAWLIGKLAVHRGMFHSVPALLIASSCVYLTSASSQPSVKLLLAVGIGIGFLSHLVLDELYSIEWTGVRLKLNRFAGSALKMFGKSPPANIITYGILITLSYGVLIDAGILKSQLKNSPGLTPNVILSEEEPFEEKQTPFPLAPPSEKLSEAKSLQVPLPNALPFRLPPSDGLPSLQPSPVRLPPSRHLKPHATDTLPSLKFPETQPDILIK